MEETEFLLLLASDGPLVCAGAAIGPHDSVSKG